MICGYGTWISNIWRKSLQWWSFCWIWNVCNYLRKIWYMRSKNGENSCKFYDKLLYLGWHRSHIWYNCWYCAKKIAFTELNIEVNQTLISREQPYVIYNFFMLAVCSIWYWREYHHFPSNLEHGAFNFLFPWSSTMLEVLAIDHGSFEVVFWQRVGDREGWGWIPSRVDRWGRSSWSCSFHPPH